MSQEDFEEVMRNDLGIVTVSSVTHGVCSRLEDEMEVVKNDSTNCLQNEEIRPNLLKNNEDLFRNETSIKSSSSCTSFCVRNDQLRQMETSDQEIYSCLEPQCPIKFNRVAHRNRHYKTSHQKDIKKGHMCDLCSQVFGRKADRERHYSSVHLKTKYPCAQCGQEFSRKEDVDRHAKVAHNTKEGLSQYCCPDEDCHKNFSRRDDMERHCRAVHLRTEQFLCDYCPSQFSRKDDVDRHCRTVHLKTTQFFCQFCPAKFSRKDYVERHKKARHREEEAVRHLCPRMECGKCFTRNSDLSRHLRTVHRAVL